MSLDEQVAATASAADTAAESTSSATSEDNEVERQRSEKILKAKELYSSGSRNFLLKNYAQAADELSGVCALYAELYGEQADELGMPYLFYAKSLLELSLDENKVIDVPDEADDDDDDDDDDDEDDEDEEVEEKATAQSNGTVVSDSEALTTKKNGTNSIQQITKLSKSKEENEKKEEADSTAYDKDKAESTGSPVASSATKEAADAEVSSTDDKKMDGKNENKTPACSSSVAATVVTTAATNDMDEKPSTSNGQVQADGEDVNSQDDEDNDTASNLQLAWEILETAAKIFARRGASGRANLAEVQTELGNIQFENCILDAARADYEKALNIYMELDDRNYRRAKAELYYKIGLTYLMQQMNKEGATALKDACRLIQAEIDSINAAGEMNDRATNAIQDLEETKQEIEVKIAEIEEMQAQQIADVRAALDSYIKPITSKTSDDAAGPSSSSASTSRAASSSAQKPNDISHLIKRKKPEEPSSEAEAAASPAKRPAV